MPELPEVETIRIGLGALLPGRKVISAEHTWAKSFPNADTDVRKFLIGAKVVLVKRRAKALIIELSTKYSLVIHLKMTGQLVFREEGGERFGAGHPNDSLIGELPDKSTRVILSFDNGSKLFFNDQRKFGWVRLLPTAEIPQIDFFKKLGPEPLSTDFTWKILRDRLKRRSNTNIKAALLDQTVVAGIGNIYSDESLWDAKIHPATQVKNLSDAKIKKLYEAIVAILKLSIEKGGSTDKNYVDAEGRRGSYLKFANVFRREGQPCPRHPDTNIVKIRIAGRGTHICPRCQQLR
ncbi:MAG TPA: bifunctional DNA-formamidopyrimidine glycosylase/DNA-(apurinic or apyrimidinic site) lyase [Candidatus Saccharimonadales bacterium]|nr:bifunctional DNA-formamidopyrimidine glycosylase/DNA-(apurinic or apyrimidinic site) lyase [Candidatus Saccharimonadales bacterium]